jgi:hypothetical protein
MRSIPQYNYNGTFTTGQNFECIPDHKRSCHNQSKTDDLLQQLNKYKSIQFLVLLEISFECLSYLTFAHAFDTA